jgi:hypothetical protein
MVRHPHQRGDANAERGGADRRRRLDRIGRVLHIDIERVVAAGLRHHRDIDGAREAQVHAQHELAGSEFFFHRFVGHVFAPAMGRETSARRAYDWQ